MIIVAGALIVDPQAREAYLERCAGVVAAARDARGCLDFALSPDLIEPGRINVFERWDSDDDLKRFRGSGPGATQVAVLLDVRVKEFEVVDESRLAHRPHVLRGGRAELCEEDAARLAGQRVGGGSLSSRADR